MKKKLKPKRIDYLILVLILLNVVAIPLFARKHIDQILVADKIISSPVETDGLVIGTIPRRNRGGFNYHAFIKFTDQNGKTFSFETPSQTTGEPSVIGEKVRVIYYRDNPNYAATGDLKQWKTGNIIGILIIIFRLSIPTIWILWMYKTKWLY